MTAFRPACLLSYLLFSGFYEPYIYLFLVSTLWYDASKQTLYVCKFSSYNYNKARERSLKKE